MLAHAKNGKPLTRANGRFATHFGSQTAASIEWGARLSLLGKKGRFELAQGRHGKEHLPQRHDGHDERQK
jgi:hypothetical protein